MEYFTNPATQCFYARILGFFSLDEFCRVVSEIFSDGLVAQLKFAQFINFDNFSERYFF